MDRKNAKHLYCLLDDKVFSTFRAEMKRIKVPMNTLIEFLIEEFLNGSIEDREELAKFARERYFIKKRQPELSS